MNKVAILVLADTESHGDLGRAVNALEVAKEYKEAGDQVALVFDGAGTRWIAEFSKSEHKRHARLLQIADRCPVHRTISSEVRIVSHLGDRLRPVN
jgi:uncharacterized OsmC-like protein